MISHVRRQHAVGQGLFHSAEVDFQATQPKGFPWSWPLPPTFDVPKQPTAMRYVYDCGSTRGAASRRIEIDLLIDRFGVGEKLDFVFLSHADEDHVNGLTQLLDPVSGLRAATIFMPNLSVLERLAAWAASTAAENAAAGAAEEVDETYGRLIIDPASALKNQLGARRVVFVGGDGEPPEGIEANEIGPDDDDENREREFTWRLNGAREVLEGGDNVYHVPSGEPVRVSVGKKESADWILLPHVASGVSKRLDEFEKQLAAQLGLTLAQVRDLLSDIEQVTKLLRTDSAKLKKAYELSAPSVNASTLSLFSGPTSGHTPKGWQLVVGRGVKAGRRFLHGGPVGWLGTGDAELNLPGYLADFLGVMSSVKDEVGIMTVPHHGSVENNVSALWDTFPALHTCVTSADPTVKVNGLRSWRHPATEVVLDIASRGLQHIVVTSDERSGVTEWILLD